MKRSTKTQHDKRIHCYVQTAKRMVAEYDINHGVSPAAARFQFGLSQEAALVQIANRLVSEGKPSIHIPRMIAKEFRQGDFPVESASDFFGK